MMNLKKIVYALCCLVVVTGCSTTKNLPEDETLYAGIEEIAFGYKAGTKKKKKEKEKGVITSLADAYKTVDEVLVKKNVSILQKKELTQEEKDSIKQEEEHIKEAYTKAQEEVEAALAYAPNASLMGSSSIRHPFPMRLWIYNSFVNSKNKIGKWIFNQFAATPVYISTVNPEVRSLVAQNTLRNYGFFFGTVTHEILPQKNPREAKISYTIMPNQLYRLDSISYLNFSVGADSLIRKSMSQTLLKKGDAFSVLNLDGERNRLSSLFRNNGFFYYKPEYIAYRADTVAQPTKVQLQVMPAANIPKSAQKRYYLGKTRINIYQQNNFELTDSIGRKDIKLYFSDPKHKTPLKMNAIRRYLFYQKGDLYREDLQNFIQEQLSGMGVFSQVSMKYVPRDSMITSDTLDIEINGVLDKPYDGEFEAKVTSKSNDQVGPGISFGMSKRNAFRGAEKLKFEVHGSYEWQTNSNVIGDNSVINSYEYGTSLSLDYPRLVMPGWRKLSRKAFTSTSFTLDATWLNRANFFSMVSLGARVAYTYQSNFRIKHEFVPFRLDYDELLSTTPRFDSIMNANEALYISMRNQFVPSMRYIMTYTSSRRTRNPIAFTLDIKESGNVMSGIFAAFGKPFSQLDKKLFNVPFAQYIRLSADFWQSYKLTSRSSLVGRISIGSIYSYGNSTNAPYNDLFYVGGANSIRAFNMRGVGPGSNVPGLSRYSYVDQMGDIKFEANLEYRFPIVGSLYGATFLDAGNVWLMHADPNRPGGNFDLKRLGREIALGTGVGVRYDLDFLVLRFDVGVGLHAPYDTGKSGYYNLPRFKNSLAYHLAVGYPF